MIRLILTLNILLFLIPASAEYSRLYLDEHAFAMAKTDGIEIAYKVIGDPANPPVILIMGLGASHALWGDEFVKGVENAGYRVVLIDNRDVGHSTKFTEWGDPTLWWQFLKNELGFGIDAPYVLEDMAVDVIAVMDALEIDRAHIVGASMGGMIAQIVAARYPQRTLSLVSIMSTTGAPHLPSPSGQSSNSLQQLAEGDGDEDFTEMMKARGFYTEAIPRQLMAIIKTGDRSTEVASIKSPTLILHGEDDTLLPPAHGKHTAELIQNSEIQIFPGMGHNIPEPILPDLLARMTQHMDLNRN